jgi:hypothetical protein
VWFAGEIVVLICTDRIMPQIQLTIPHYDDIHEEILNFVKSPVSPPQDLTRYRMRDGFICPESTGHFSGYGILHRGPFGSDA